MKPRHYVQAPRIEIVLVPDEERDINNPSSLFDVWLVAHTPDGKKPTTVRVDGGPFDRNAATGKVTEIWAALNKQFADPSLRQGMMARREVALLPGAVIRLPFCRQPRDHRRRHFRRVLAQECGESFVEVASRHRALPTAHQFLAQRRGAECKPRGYTDKFRGLRIFVSMKQIINK